MTEALMGNEKLLKAGWRWMAQNYADQKEFQKAYEMASRFGSQPLTQDMSTLKTGSELKLEFLMNPGDVTRGLTLLTKQLNTNQNDEAMETIQKMKSIPESPAYIFYQEADLWKEKQHWENAWKAWLAYEDKKNKKNS